MSWIEQFGCRWYFIAWNNLLGSLVCAWVETYYLFSLVSTTVIAFAEYWSNDHGFASTQWIGKAESFMFWAFLHLQERVVSRSHHQKFSLSNRLDREFLLQRLRRGDETLAVEQKASCFERFCISRRGGSHDLTIKNFHYQRGLIGNFCSSHYKEEMTRLLWSRKIYVLSIFLSPGEERG